MAEVLITLAIIGVVAAMTIPTLIQKYEVKRTVSLLKETYSVFSQALIYAINENGNVGMWKRYTLDMEPVDKTLLVNETADKFKKYLKINKECLDDLDKKTCWLDTAYNEFYHLGSTEPDSLGIYTVFAAPFVLANGVKIAIYSQPYSEYPTCKNYNGVPCLNIFVKTDNASKSEWGKNLFAFYVYDDKVLPAGHRDTTYTSFANQCNQTGGNMSMNGLGCTAWVIENGNMDYLNCNDLSWDGKHKCSD